jgi:GT2 family glycosyltransferase
MIKVGIIVLVHNAPDYLIKCISSIKKHTNNVAYSIVVVDNASDSQTKQIIVDYYLNNTIDIICGLECNRFFSKANNIGAKILPEDCSHILLLNSDVEILHDDWLSNLITLHERGITTYGACLNNMIDSYHIPDRGDGYCLMIDRDLYYNFWLDENFPWFWSITKLQGLILNENYAVKAIHDHSKFIKHYGGRSGNYLKNLPGGIYIEPTVILSWFQNKKIRVL